jgi:kanamycin kinase
MEVPAIVNELAGGGVVRVMWQNQVGGLTFEVSDGGERRFIKWAPTGSGLDLNAEVARLSWAAPFTPVPRVLDSGDDEHGAWLMTAAVPGETAVSERWTSAPEIAVGAVGEGLRAFHEALPVSGCPFSWSVDDRVAGAQRRASKGKFDPASWHPEHRRLTVDQALAQLAEIPPIDHAVVCHGDACAPNTLITDDGRWSGHVDLGAMGVADRWADLAVATWSTQWNYGPGWEAHLLSAYGVPHDHDRTRYYRLLWDLGP